MVLFGDKKDCMKVQSFETKESNLSTACPKFPSCILFEICDVVIMLVVKVQQKENRDYRENSMRKVDDGKRKEKREKRKEKIMTFIVATNVVASRPPERRPTVTPTARANK